MRYFWLLGLPLLLAGCNTVNSGPARAFHFNDIRRPNGQSRGLEETRADGLACDEELEAQPNSVSKAYRACMLRRGWKYAYSRELPSMSPVADNPPTYSDPTPTHDYAADNAMANDATAQTVQGIVDSSNAIQAAAMVNR